MSSPTRPSFSLLALLFTAWGIAFAGLLWGLGDVFDGVGYLIVWSLFWLLHKALVKRDAEGSTHSWPGLALLAVSIHMAAAFALNRVNGYPDKELWPLAMLLGWGSLHLAALVLRRTLWQERRILLALACVVYLPIVELPAWSLRQAAGAWLVERPSPAGPAVAYYSKIGRDKAYAVGKSTAGSNTVLVFERHANRYRFERQVDLLDGHGSMDRQSPNLPWLLTLVLRMPR
jgi:hypothetical protein